jgi:hypothetical protein
VRVAVTVVHEGITALAHVHTRPHFSNQSTSMQMRRMHRDIAKNTCPKTTHTQDTQTNATGGVGRRRRQESAQNKKVQAVPTQVELGYRRGDPTEEGRSDLRDHLAPGSHPEISVTRFWVSNPRAYTSP